MREVYSSVVSHIDYRDGHLYVRWARGGKVSVYKDVPEKLANEVMNAPSIGQALRRSIQDNFTHGYLTD